MGGIRLAAKPLGVAPSERPESEWMGLWYGPEHLGTERAKVQQQLENSPGKHLVFVRYDITNHWSVDEWVYNSPDIDKSKVIWAREMDRTNNEDLVRHYSDRQVWLVQPDLSSGILTRYLGVRHPISPRELASTEGAPTY
jgi:hypothetical protein